MKLTELTTEQLQDLSLEDFKERIIGEVRERWINADSDIPNKECTAYKEDEHILLAYSSGDIVILEASEYYLISSEVRSILYFKPSVLSQLFSVGVGEQYAIALEKAQNAYIKAEKERIEKKEREQLKYLSGKYG